ncbi:hypothetical protein PISMIDRAFT_451187 [Pisolithus microcarpus 441]|uniref:Unplaced genomic scaffold scaffold_40, whole genome shotgun sequence n=1 Tax=Pisolithus microcarpus 441 TaxID=765257 RepID=A0A0C9Z3I5_9AGAM|nr:hypothetical protein PISMIDRAFT_451187 [Pisolithus microcarpus 441]
MIRKHCSGCLCTPRRLLLARAADFLQDWWSGYFIEPTRSTPTGGNTLTRKNSRKKIGVPPPTTNNDSPGPLVGYIHIGAFEAGHGLGGQHQPNVIRPMVHRYAQA